MQSIELINYGSGAYTMSTGNYNAATSGDRKHNTNDEAAVERRRRMSSGEDSRCESDEEFVSPQSNTAVSRQSYREAMNTPLSGDGTGHSGSGFVEMPASSTCVEGVSPMAIYNEERMRRKLQFYFMNPIEKWQARRKFPYKFVVQVCKSLMRYY